jgi:hypothetical protein
MDHNPENRHKINGSALCSRMPAMKKCWRIALFLVAFMLASEGMWAQSHYKKTSVCEMLKVGKVNRVLNVELGADVVSDGMHGAILTDAKCPGKGLLLDVFPADVDPSVSEFEKTLWSGAPGTTGRKVSGTFFGKLRLDHKNKKLSISVMRVENLLTVHTDEQPQ